MVEAYFADLKEVVRSFPVLNGWGLVLLPMVSDLLLVSEEAYLGFVTSLLGCVKQGRRPL